MPDQPGRRCDATCRDIETDRDQLAAQLAETRTDRDNVVDDREHVAALLRQIIELEYAPVAAIAARDSGYPPAVLSAARWLTGTAGQDAAQDARDAADLALTDALHDRPDLCPDCTRTLLERLALAAEAYLTRGPEATEDAARTLRYALGEAALDAWMWLRPDAAAPPASATQPARPAPAEGQDTSRPHSGSQGRLAWAPPKDLIGRLQLLAGDLVDTVARLAEHGLPDSGREHLRRYAIASREAINAAGYDAERTVTWAIRRHARDGLTFTDPAASEHDAHHWAALWPAHSGGHTADVLRQEAVTTVVATYDDEQEPGR